MHDRHQMGYLVDNAIRRAGLLVQRGPRARDLDLSRRNKTQGQTVEFVGPSAIGKSTIFEKMRPSLKNNWLFEQHTRRLNAPEAKEQEFSSVLRSVYFDRIRDLERDVGDIIKCSEIIDRVTEIVRVALVLTAREFPRGFVLDEGIAHFFAGQIIALPEDQAHKFLFGRALIFVLPSQASTLVNRRSGRSGIQATQQDVEEAESQIKIYQSLATKCSETDTPHIMLNADEPVSKNAKRAFNFLETLTSEFR